MMGMYGGGGMNPSMPPQQQQQQQQQVKHDIFVGNLAFNTTEEQLHQAFSEIGTVINVRLVTDNESGKPKGFAFVEFKDPYVLIKMPSL
jgi:RNA recognition motif-containing protein